MNSILKLLEYVRKVAWEPIEYDGKYLDTPDTFVINNSFFYKDDCIVCGRCCSAQFNTVYTKSGIDFIKNMPEEAFFNPDMYGEYPIPLANRDALLESIVEHKYIVNGKEVSVFESPCLTGAKANDIFLPHKPKAGPRCRWMMTDAPGLYRCGIHPVRSVTCGLPHCRINFSNQSKTSSLGVGQYGRNWALGCPIELKPSIDLPSVQTRVYWLKELDKASNDLGIITVLPDVIKYIESLYPMLAEHKAPAKQKIFGMRPTHKKLFWR